MWSARKTGVSLMITPPKFRRRPAAPPPPRAPGRGAPPPPPRQRLLHPPFDALRLADVDHRADVDALVQGVADHHRQAGLDEPLGEGLVHFALAVDALHGDADLPRVVVL